MFRLSNWIFVGCNAYFAYTFVPWQNRSVTAGLLICAISAYSAPSAVHAAHR
ncbi:hypothetical protein LMG28614_06961 [Paraburkholderia ultramafica]|uniref:Uncharacterized protein n=1 Tax=Paraburkholderia ultramafica TaxID=1544867 RepID=A0A6S7BQJ8_9BURK|nr:hypothetical protein LMG28614_06961 [Paraburkholderia ultramafica]